MSAAFSIIVSGMGRCGTSLLMQMLDRAGVPCIGEFPAFEDDFSGFKTFRAERLRDLGPMAVKLIDPARLKIPPLSRHVVIWLDRDTHEQAKSIAKLMAAGGDASISRAQRRQIARNLKEDRPGHIACFKGAPLIELRFEDLVSNSFATASRISEFLSGYGWFLDVHEMKGAVFPRPTACLPTMAEFKLLQKSVPAARVS